MCLLARSGGGLDGSLLGCGLADGDHLEVGVVGHETLEVLADILDSDAVERLEELVVGIPVTEHLHLQLIHPVAVLVLVLVKLLLHIEDSLLEELLIQPLLDHLLHLVLDSLVEVLGLLLIGLEDDHHL